MQQPAISHAEVMKVIFGLMVAIFLGALEQTITATALPAIARDFTDISLLSWVVSAYLLAMVSATPVIGKLSDLYGRRLMLRICTLGFLGSSLLCAFAVNMPMLIGARLLQGIGGAGFITLSQAIMADITTPRERGRYVGYISIIWASAGLSGPLFGGLITDFLGWRWIFLVNIPICLLVLFVTDRQIRHLQQHKRAGHIDYLSVLTFVTAATALLLALSWGGRNYGWASPTILGLLGCAVALSAAFVWRQHRVAEPIIPPAFLHDRVILPSFICAFLAHGLYTAIGALLPTYFQLGLGHSASEGGLLLIPVTLVSSAAAAMTGRFISVTGTYRLPVLIGLPVAALLIAILGWNITAITSLGAVILLVLVGIFMGPIFPTMNISVQNAAPTQIGAATGALSFFRNLGGAVIVTAGTAALLSHIQGAGYSADILDLPREGTAAMPAATQALFRDAFGPLFLGASVILFLAFLFFTRVENRKLSGGPDKAP